MKLEQEKLSRILETAIVAARLGGQRAMEQIGYVKSSVKNDIELVTQADGQCQQIIIERIKENYPDHGFIGEEGRQGGIFKQPPRGSEPIWWVIDPIDGTTNYAHRLPIFAISIAAMYDGKPIVGVVFDPATESMFTAVKGRESQLDGRRITAGAEKINKFACAGIDSHYVDEIPEWICEIIKQTRVRNLGTTALQFCYVASGALIATIANRPRLWDFAAGTLIAETAGAVVTDWQGNKILPLDLDKYEAAEFRALAANKKVHPKILKMIK